MPQEYASKDDIKHLRELMEQYNKMAQVTIDKAEASVNERLLGMNEFREQINDMIATLATKENLVSSIDAVNVRVDGIEKWKATSQGANRVIVVVASIVSGLIGALIAHILK
jgi:hypothetical protein